MKPIKTRIEASARHVHLKPEHFEKLFGKSAELHEKAKLSQKGEFAAEETVDVISGKNSIPNVRIVGPTRPYTQVELSSTDARSLSLDPPLRRSGKVKGSTPVTLRGPKGTVRISEGAIIQKRHVHMSDQEAKRFGLKDGDTVAVKIGGKRGALLHEVDVKVAPHFQLSVHLDLDEANAVGLKPSTKGEIIR